MGGWPLWPPTVPRLAARSSHSNPRGSGPEVLKRERGHVTAESGVSEVGVFRALQPNEHGVFNGCNICMLLYWVTLGQSGVRMVVADGLAPIWCLAICKHHKAGWYVAQPNVDCQLTIDHHINGLVQERRNCIANALELRLASTKPSICH